MPIHHFHAKLDTNSALHHHLPSDMHAKQYMKILLLFAITIIIRHTLEPYSFLQSVVISQCVCQFAGLLEDQKFQVP